jgi:hypothetical protein
MAAGAGLLAEAGIGLAMILFALVGLRAFRDRFLQPLTRDHQTISVSYQRGHGTLGPLIEAIEGGGGRLQNLSIDDEEEMRHVALDVLTPDAAALRSRVAPLADLPEVDVLTCQ